MGIRTFIGVLAAVLAIGLLLWLGIYAYGNIAIPFAAPVDRPAALTAFLVAKPNLIVDGSNLGKVEIWAVPSSRREISEEDYLLIGDALLQPGGDPLTQIWTLPIPEEPVTSTEIFAKGFDSRGEFVGQMSLPYLGANQIFNALWSEPDPSVTPPAQGTQRHFSFILKVGEAYTAGDLSVKLLEIENDSRCPKAAVCVWAGEVSAKVRLIVGDRDEIVTMHSMSAPSVFDGHQIGISDVLPARLDASEPAAADYRVTFSVERL